VYLDTAVLVKLLVREPDSDFYARTVEGQIVWSSQIVLTECFSALLRKERERQIGAPIASGRGPRSNATWRSIA
jgi:predicted nucleic acid-binding protein